MSAARLTISSVAFLACAFFAAALWPVPHPPPIVCSLVPVPVTRSATDVFFIGTATADSVLTGPGDLRYGFGAGHSGFGRKRTIYGQRVRIEKLTGISATRLPTGTTGVILVPWDYGADCSLVIWGKSALWEPPGTRGVFKAQPRPREQWVENTPTLDVFHPDFSPYPSGSQLDRYESSPDTALLSPEDALELFERLPDLDQLERAPDSATRPLLQWAADNPALATRAPARMILRFVHHMAEEERVAQTPVPIAGTYRFVITALGRDSLVLYARTEGRPWSTLRSRYQFGSPLQEQPRRDTLIGYYVMTAWRKSIHALPRSFNEDDETSPNIAISLTPMLETADSAVWRGEASALERERDESFWKRAIQPHRALVYETPRDWYYVPGFWITYRDGAVRYRRTFPPDGTPVVTIVGERVSTDVMTRRLR